MTLLGVTADNVRDTLLTDEAHLTDAQVTPFIQTAETMIFQETGYRQIERFEVWDSDVVEYRIGRGALFTVTAVIVNYDSNVLVEGTDFDVATTTGIITFGSDELGFGDLVMVEYIPDASVQLEKLKAALLITGRSELVKAIGITAPEIGQMRKDYEELRGTMVSKFRVLGVEPHREPFGIW